ncbi:MAG: hypothetical protein FJ096_12155 [Deltaproteobacteria bacterium]|nr:hypothetical protein [Deltaproteobacteria bacterium]
MRPDEAAEPGDGAGGPPWLPTLGTWFLAAAVLLALPRMWIPAATSFVVGSTIAAVAARRKRDAAPPVTSGEPGVRAERDPS